MNKYCNHIQLKFTVSELHTLRDLLIVSLNDLAPGPETSIDLCIQFDHLLNIATAFHQRLMKGEGDPKQHVVVSLSIARTQTLLGLLHLNIGKTAFYRAAVVYISAELHKLLSPGGMQHYTTPN